MFEMAKEENYLLQLLQNMQGTIDRVAENQQEQGKLLDKVHDQTKETNGKVKKLRSEMDSVLLLKNKEGFKLPAVSDTLLKFMALTVLIIVAIIAASLRVDIGGLIG